MLKRDLLFLPLALILLAGCSGNGVTPERTGQAFESDVYTFQLAVVLAGEPFVCPEFIPTDVPIRYLVEPCNMQMFASISLAAFNVYYEPSDWDDWLTTGYPQDRLVLHYEPSDWDDWLTSQTIGNPAIRRVHNDSDLQWLIDLGEIIDPFYNYEPSDWDDWLVNYEPSDWDDWLVNATLNDLAALNGEAVELSQINIF